MTGRMLCFRESEREGDQRVQEREREPERDKGCVRLQYTEERRKKILRRYGRSLQVRTLCIYTLALAGAGAAVLQGAAPEHR